MASSLPRCSTSLFYSHRTNGFTCRREARAQLSGSVSRVSARGAFGRRLHPSRRFIFIPHAIKFQPRCCYQQIGDFLGVSSLPFMHPILNWRCLEVPGPNLIPHAIKFQPHSPGIGDFLRHLFVAFLHDILNWGCWRCLDRILSRMPLNSNHALLLTRDRDFLGISSLLFSERWRVPGPNDFSRDIPLLKRSSSDRRLHCYRDSDLCAIGASV
ncbi:hypothetical protein B0H14DRAFT_912742 [Mycena olivaceomarginata]|nr:hypothetical protein B0H14DRAFT_912742 [Mycena olivaceomarginata]